MNTMKKSDELKGLKIKYLNIILLTVILSSLINSIYIVFIFNSWNLDPQILIIITLPFIFGGILSGFVSDGKKAILGGVMVGAISAAVSIDINLLLFGLITLPTSEWSFYLPLGIIYATTFSLIIGAFLGIIGSIMGVFIKRWLNR